MPSHIIFRVNSFLWVALLFIFSLSIFSCSGERDSKKHSGIREIYKPDTLSLLIKFESSLFPIPSPYQASHLVKSHGIPFDEALLSKPDNAKRYSTNFKKALNLGIYGTNLSYLNIYERTPQSIAYLGVLKRLSEDLNLTPAFNANFFVGLEKNISNTDSLMVHLARTYRNADSYLRESNRTEIGALILAGGWVESIYVLTQIAHNHSNRDIINRIGEQKHPLDNLIEVLTPYYYNSTDFSELIDKLIDLAYEFDGIIYSYSYKAPVIDEENRLIHINSQSRVVISEYHLDIISQKVKAIRDMIVE